MNGKLITIGCGKKSTELFLRESVSDHVGVIMKKQRTIIINNLSM